ncbi:aldehyde dehydrogenase [Collybia nuda]|uniref:Aldehyde dehydrogenase n=1 Tax=Collybia nuda TaxID=64659 RepID=A0A9P5Y1W1_9AGAR|nr:aldehyde dehydrogenase [Collybia nuda]
MAKSYTHHFDTPLYKGTISINTRLFINGEWVDPVDKATIDVLNPATGKIITKVAVASSKDVDLAVEAAHKAYKTTWGLHCPGNVRGRLLNKLADLMEQHYDELAALEALDAGKVLGAVKSFEMPLAIGVLRYYAGWADKITGKAIEINGQKFAYTRLEPYGVVGTIVPWNFPLMLGMAKLGPALATGNTLIWKPSEIAPLTALKIAELVQEAGFPPGVVNLVNGYGRESVGQAMANHPGIAKISFTGSCPVGRKVLHAAAITNLKDVTLELGGKGAAIVFEDADMEQAVKWAMHGVYFNNGQCCIASPRIYVQDTIYDEFLHRFTEASREMTVATGDPLLPGMQLGPMASQVQFDRVMTLIASGKKEGATIHLGGSRQGTKGYFIQPTIFTNATSDMRIVREEIFGPVCVVTRFQSEEEVIDVVNNTVYGLASSVFTMNIERALRVTHAIEVGMVWVNSVVAPEAGAAFGGFKQSGTGREYGEEAIATYTQVKAVHVNLSAKL